MSALSMLFLVGALWSAEATASEDCPQAASAAMVQATIASAENAFAALDVERFMKDMDTAAYQLPCLSDVLEASTIARIHRLQGLRQYVASDEERAAQAFAAARSVEPNYVLPTWLVPDGHALRGLYGQVPIENAASEPVPAPLSGSLRFDGVVGLSRSVRWPTLVQVLDANERPLATAYLYPGDAMPAYAMAPVEVARRGVFSGNLPRKTGMVLSGASVAAGLASGVLYGLAVASAADFEAEHPEWDGRDLVESRSRTNGLVLGSGASAVVAVGVGATALFLVEW